MTTAMHMFIFDHAKVSLRMMKFAINHKFRLSAWKSMFVLGLNKFMIALGIEYLNTIYMVE